MCAYPNHVRVPDNAMDLYSSSDYWILSGPVVYHAGEKKMVNFNLNLLREGQTVGCLVNKERELHYYVDGKDQGVGWVGMPRYGLLWGFADVYGQVTKIKLEYLCGK